MNTKNLLLKFVMAAIILAALHINVHAYSYISVSDPHSTDWNSDQGSIDDITFIVTPKGIYMECLLELTLSPNETEYSSSDTVEITFDFSLPPGSMITEAKLLIEDSMVNARLMERWAATQIYENIVQRVRRDPLILYKQYDDQYYGRIYPMLGNSSRTLQIKYMVPATWTKNYASVLVPTDLLNASKVKPDKVTILVNASDEWKNAKILEIPNAFFQDYAHAELGSIKKLEIKHSGENYSSLSVGFDNPMENGLYIQTYDTGNEGYYQMAFLPSQVMDISIPKKVAIIIDHDKDLTYVSKNELYTKLENGLKEYFTDDDYFNLVYYDGSEVQYASENWVSADDESITNTFNNIGSNTIADENQIDLLIPEAVNLISSAGDEASILILSSSNHVKDKDEADEIIESLKNIMNPLPQFNIINMMEKYYYWYEIVDEYYWGNDYLYSQLAKETNGEYFTLDYYNTFDPVLTRMFQSFDGILTSFDIHTSMDEGFCYSRYNINGNGPVYLNKPILQTGKYYGSFPFEVEISALTTNGVFYSTKSYRITSVNINDRALEQIWGGNYLNELEHSDYNYTTTQEIINTSIHYHVLSCYTAFLALEPGMSYEVPDDISQGNPETRWSVASEFSDVMVAEDAMINSYSGSYYGDERGQWYVEGEYADPTNIEKHDIVSTIQFKNYPNPFIDQIAINITLKDEIELSNALVQIYNLSGEVVKIFNTSNLGSGNRIEITWDGSNGNGSDLSSGTYILSVITPTESRSIKLLKLN
ncbi:T9SS type A sorting domain-containing protein [Bacteroidota bacterium]